MCPKNKERSKYNSSQHALLWDDLIDKPKIELEGFCWVLARCIWGDSRVVPSSRQDSNKHAESESCRLR